LNSIHTTVGGALDRARRLPADFVRAGRGPLTLGIAATLIGLALVPPAPARADLSPDPAVTRLQVVLTNIHIYNARDWGSGELKLNVVLREDGGGPAPLASMRYAFDADSGEDVSLERVFPATGDTMVNGVSPDGGLPVAAGHRYFVGADMTESDSASSDEDLGDVVVYMDQTNDWGVGTHTVRGTKLPSEDPADYALTFEIRRVRLPDLRPADVKVDDLPGSPKKRICVPVQNTEGGIAGPFDVALTIDGSVPPNGRITVPGLAPGQATDACIETELASGSHEVKAIVNGLRQAIEQNETNNVSTKSVKVAAATPTPTPSQADLTVSAIKVRGQLPDGKDDCRDGKNDVAVVVKNAGTAEAGAFTVRLTVDAETGEAVEESVKGLEAGKEREIRFDDVKLKKGDHTLSAVADAENAVAESDEANNALEVGARCRDAS